MYRIISTVLLRTWVRITGPVRYFMGWNTFEWVRHWAGWSDDQWGDYSRNTRVGGRYYTARERSDRYGLFTPQECTDWVQTTGSLTPTP